jgi:cbb3-type cytochrome oxidase maturation protein
MEALYYLIPLSIVIVFIAIWAFFGMSDSGQFDDMVGPALRILQDDDGPVCESATPKSASANERH